MRKIIPIFIALFSQYKITAQNQLAVFAGPQASTVRYSIEGQHQEAGYKFGFQAGIGMKTPFEGRIYFAPSVFYSLKGYDVSFSRVSFPPDSLAINNSTRLHTFEIAPLLQVDLGTGPGHAYIKAGPSFDLQLSGKEEYDLKGGGTVSRDMKFSFADYGRFSFNALIQFGYETNSFLVFAQYSHGLTSLNNFDGGPQIRHGVFGLSFGKYINRKKLVIDTKNKE